MMEQTQEGLKNQVPNQDHLRFMRSLGGNNDQGLRTKVSRKKSRALRKKKPQDQNEAEESGEEKIDEDEDQST